MKNIGNLFVRLFVISLLTFRYFSIIVSLFGAGAAPFFPAPAPALSKAFRRLRLQLRLRPKCVGSGGSGSGSASLASGQLVMRLPHVHGGVTMHVRTCTPHFYISGTAEPIALIFGI